MDSARVLGCCEFSQSPMIPFITLPVFSLKEMERYMEAFTTISAGVRHFYARKEAFRIYYGFTNRAIL